MAAFDEMGIAGGPTRPLYHQVARWLDETPPELLASRRAQAEFMFRRIGITFGVYGDKDAAERLIPFDIVPRLISRPEWRRLEAGLTQRARALNLFLKDVYGQRAILKETIEVSTSPASPIAALTRAPPKAWSSTGSSLVSQRSRSKKWIV